MSSVMATRTRFDVLKFVCSFVFKKSKIYQMKKVCIKMKEKRINDCKKIPKKIRKRAFELEKEFSHLFVGFGVFGI